MDFSRFNMNNYIIHKCVSCKH